MNGGRCLSPGVCRGQSLDIYQIILCEKIDLNFIRESRETVAKPCLLLGQNIEPKPVVLDYVVISAKWEDGTRRYVCLSLEPFDTSHLAFVTISLSQ